MSEPLTLGEIISAALGAMPDDRPLLVRAAFGNLDALRELAEAAFTRATEPGASAPLAYMEAITLARLATAQGDQDDGRHLLFLLSSFASFWSGSGNDDLAISFEAQALQLAEALAEEGDDETADMVVASADGLSPAVHLKARELRAKARMQEKRSA